jgi:hypothetical protein
MFTQTASYTSFYLLNTVYYIKPSQFWQAATGRNRGGRGVRVQNPHLKKGQILPQASFIAFLLLLFLVLDFQKTMHFFLGFFLT